MAIIKLREPQPRPTELPYEELEYPKRSTIYLPIPAAFRDVSFFSVLQDRRTRRHFDRLRVEDLSAVLWATAKVHNSHQEPSGFLWQHRCVPSSGGRHPIDILVIPAPDGSARGYIYNAFGHKLDELSEAAESIIGRFHDQLQSIVPTGQGTVLWFVADYMRTKSKYQNPESLVWRDAGALLGAIYFVSEALGLNCCGYGINGDAQIAELFENDRLGGVGGCVIGARVAVNDITKPVSNRNTTPRRN